MKDIEISDIWEYEKNSRIQYNMDASDAVATNSAYGHMYQLKKYAGIDQRFLVKCTIEHGMALPANGSFWTEVTQCVKTIIVPNNQRKRVIERYYGKKAIVIGPYILYAESLCEETSVISLKKQLGKTLLVFPAHGVIVQDAVFDFEKLIERIEEVGKAYKTIIICLHFSDILKNRAKDYEKYGYRVVCAGTDADCNFLPRLRTIIELSDAVMANAFTTGLIYAMCLEKPVYYFEQEIGKKRVKRVVYIRNPIKKSYEEFMWITRRKEMDLLNEQIEWCKANMGLNEKKTREEMTNILSSLIRKDR